MPDANAPRHDGRRPDELRSHDIRPGFLSTVPGNVLIHMGRTRILCAVSVVDRVPRWMHAQGVPGGWITTEYSILPYATVPRTDRESSRGRVGGRTHEIQRLIGRSLRACVDLEKLGPRTLWVDCDVLEADGGTRMAAVTGASVALDLALRDLTAREVLEENPMRSRIAGVSVGIVEDRPVLDLDYVEDSAAAVDMNVVMTTDERLVEVQASAEGRSFSPEELDRLMELARSGIRELFRTQETALAAPSPGNTE